MELELTPEQINQIVRAARVLASGLTEEQLQLLIDCQPRLADSGFCEAAWAVARLERERGIDCADILDACAELQQEKEKWEAEVARLEEIVRARQGIVREVEERCGKIIKATEQAKAEQEKEERKLVVCQKKFEAEKRRIGRKLEECRQKANVTTQEVQVAGELKAQVGSCGFSLEEVLGLSQEFAGHQDARERLAEGLNKYHSLTGYLSALEKWAEERKRALESEVAALESQRDGAQSQVNQLQSTCHQLEVNVSQLQVDPDEEQELRQFYVRYRPLSDLLEYLVSWPEVYFFRCDNPMCAPFAGVTRSWTDRPVRRCPHCGLGMIKPDPEPFRLLNKPEGTVFPLKLG